MKPKIPLGPRFWVLDETERDAIEALFQREDVREKITQLKSRDSDSQITVVDAAYWMKGCSSLGRRRYAVLVGIGKKAERTYCLVDLKEAVISAAPKLGSARPRNNAERVVAGACALSSNLGERMLALKLMGKEMVMRKLMPQDLKFDLERLTEE